MLWVGWYGFNAGSALGADGIAANAFLTTTLSAAVGCSAWAFAEWLGTGKCRRSRLLLRRDWRPGGHRARVRLRQCHRRRHPGRGGRDSAVLRRGKAQGPPRLRRRARRLRRSRRRRHARAFSSPAFWPGSTSIPALRSTWRTSSARPFGSSSSRPSLLSSSFPSSAASSPVRSSASSSGCGPPRRTNRSASTWPITARKVISCSSSNPSQDT